MTALASPAAPAVVPSRAPLRTRTAWAAAAVLIGTGVGLLRQPGAGALNTVWAEDGRDFLATATSHSLVEAVGTSYAGYFHLVPRLLAGAAALAPPRAAAAVLAVGAAAAVALVSILVWVASAEHLESTLARAVAAGIVVLLPVGQSDVLNSVANLHWYGLYALFWVLLWSPASRAGRVAAAATVLLVAGSDILVLGLVPLAAWRVIRRPAGDRFSWVLAGLLGLGLAGQVAGLATGASSRALDPDPVRAVTGYLVRAVPAPLVGERWLGGSVDTGWLLLAGLAWLVVALVVLLARLRVTRPAWPLALTAAAHSAVLYMLPVVLSGVATPRYAVAPAMLVVTALVALLQPRDALRQPRVARLPLLAFCAVLAVTCAVNLRLDNERAHGPLWSTELDHARRQCLTATAQPAAAPQAQVTLSPGGPEWITSFPCGYLTR
jgi:hypothetical protein